MKACQEQRRRKGVVLVLVAILLLALISMLALAVDVGYLYVVKSDLQAAIDAAALAGASGLPIGRDEAFERACEYAQRNRANGQAVTLQQADVELGLWNPSTRVFTSLDPAGWTQPTTIRVVGRLTGDRGNPVGLFLASALGFSSADVVVSSTAMFCPRDIVVSLDYSASMSYDSQIRHIPDLGQDGQAEVELSLSNIWRALGSPQYGGMQLDPIYISSTTDSVILNTLGLNDVAYPYPQSAYMDSSGQVRTCTRGWSDYFDYVQGQSNTKNEAKRITDSRYLKRYGYRTLMDYFQAVQYRAAPDGIPLWQTPQEPITAVKDAVELFLDYMEQSPTDDRVGLASYTYMDGEGRLEVELTNDYNQVRSASGRRQAGHYHNQTNIAAGIEESRNELLARGRPSAMRMIVLLSDGQANWYHGSADTSKARQEAISQARTTADNKIRILTISLGADADAGLMQQIADITDGMHFIVPGGDVDDYRDQLYDVFRQIAVDRPLKLVD